MFETSKVVNFELLLIIEHAKNFVRFHQPGFFPIVFKDTAEALYVKEYYAKLY